MEKQRNNAHIHAIERQAEMTENIPGILKPEGIRRKSNLCRRCGRKLKNPKSIELGFGSICYKKFMAESNYKPLFEVRKNERETKTADSKEKPDE
jgi:hypothetical protein